MSIIETRFDSSNNHRSIQKQNGIIHHDENRITIEAEIHQFNQQLSVNDLNVVDEVELVELNPNVTLLSTDTIKRLPINVIKQKRLESQLSFNYNDCEQTYEESRVVDFNPVDMKPIHMYLLKEANDGVEDSRKYSETTSINIHEALDTLDNALLNVDNLSNYSGTWNSSMKSRSIISLSFSEVSESSLSSECSEKTLRMGNVNESIHSIENDSKSDSSNSTITNEHVEEPKSQKFIRRIERFGFDLKDTCLFPLALPMDGSDIYKGASTWESINLLAECVLSIWTNKTNLIAINDNAFILKNETTHYRWYNPVLSNSTKYLCLQPELSDRFLIQPHVHLPFRRSISDTDLTQLNFSTPFTCNDVSVLIKSSKSNEIRNEMSIDTKESNDDVRNRTKSSLGKYVKNHINSFKDLKQRKCRFNLNLTKFMTTDAKQLAAKNELENPLKFARKITKFEKNYILAIPASEMISLVFKKELSQLERLKEMLEFGQELSQLCANLICSEFTVEDQSQLIVNAIETAFLLHQKNNFQSFKSVMRGLHLPEVFRLRNAWKVVQQKFPLHLRTFFWLSSLTAYKVDRSGITSPGVCLPTISSFIDIIKVRCLSIWDRLDGKPHWKNGNHLVSLLSQYPTDEDRLEKCVHNHLIANMEAKLLKYKQKGRKVKFSFKRLINPESKTMANILRREQKRADIDYDTINKLKRTWFAIESDQIPISWTLRSLRNLPSEFRLLVIREFDSVYSQLIANIEEYKFI